MFHLFSASEWYTTAMIWKIPLRAAPSAYWRRAWRGHRQRGLSRLVCSPAVTELYISPQGALGGNGPWKFNSAVLVRLNVLACLRDNCNGLKNYTQDRRGEVWHRHETTQAGAHVQQAPARPRGTCPNWELTWQTASPLHQCFTKITHMHNTHKHTHAQTYTHIRKHTHARAHTHTPHLKTQNIINKSAWELMLYIWQYNISSK